MSDTKQKVILVCGGRNYGEIPRERKVTPEERLRAKVERYFVYAQLDELAGCNDDKPLGEYLKIVTGGARGADRIAIDWAVVNWKDFEEYKADWNSNPRSAGILRNIHMLETAKPDLVVAFPGRNGTAHMVKIAKEAGVEVIEFTTEDVNVYMEQRNAGMAK